MSQRRLSFKKVVVAITFTLLLLIIAAVVSLFPLEDTLELRKMPWRAYGVSTYLWRLSSTVFVLWLLTAIIHFLKPMTICDLMLIALGICFTVIHYTYLLSLTDEGVNVRVSLLTYTLSSIGEPLTFIDLGQVVVMVCIWRSIVLYKSHLKS